MRYLPLLLLLATFSGQALPATAEPRAQQLPDEDEPIEVDLVELTSIDWRPGAKIPSKIADLDGKRIVIKGLMALGTVQGVDSFQLVTDGCACGTSKVHHFVQVTLEDGVTDYTPDEISVTGTFSVGEIIEDGFVVSLYRLNDATIE